MRFGQHRIERERCFELRDGELRLAEATVGDREVAPNRWIARVHADRANERRERAHGVPELQPQHPDCVQRAGIRRQVCEQRLEARPGARAIPGF